MKISEKHPSLDKLRRYHEEDLPDFQACAVEDHLAECDECAATLQRMNALLFTGFTAKAHAAAIARELWSEDPLVAALHRARDLYTQFTSPIERWLDGASALWGGLSVARWGEAGLQLTSGADESAPLKVLLAGDESRAEIDMPPFTRTLTVEIAAGTSPVALLFQTGAETPVRVAPFQLQEGISTATFDGVPTGHYYLAIAPR